jgi:integrase
MLRRLPRDHLQENDLDRPERGQLRLFENSQGGRLSRSGLRYLLQCHLQAARSAAAGFSQKISPHRTGHTKRQTPPAQQRVTGEMIHDLLAHVDVKTTQICARANLEMKRRALVVPQEADAPVQVAPAAECEVGCAHHRPVRLSWAKLLKRAFDLDPEHCPNFGVPWGWKKGV